MAKTISILCTCPDEASAARLAHGLVSERLAACVNVLPAVRSIYRWEAVVEDETEALMIIKTTQGKFSAVERWLQAEHPYDVPEVLALQAAHVSVPYERWLHGAVSS